MVNQINRKELYDLVWSKPMKKIQELRIVFMGTPEFAVATLDKLVQAGCSIVGVVTAPDKAAGRGMQLQQSAVKQLEKLV